MLLLPEIGMTFDTLASYEFKPNGSKTWNLFLRGEDPVKEIDELESVAQSVYTTLRTERYKYPIYSRAHGLYIGDLIGMQRRYVYITLKSRIPEALKVDDRIIDVTDFYMDKEKSRGHDLYIGFTVKTRFGDIKGGDTFNVRPEIVRRLG